MTAQGKLPIQILRNFQIHRFASMSLILRQPFDSASLAQGDVLLRGFAAGKAQDD
jgi:hypothetical protein